MAHTLLQLDVRLREIEPPIWRTIELPGTSTLEDVHFAIQVAMGWTNSHLHQFTFDDAVYGMADTDEFERRTKDERAFRLVDLAKVGVTFPYEYDFGDGWEHDVTLVSITPSTKVVKPRCTAGARACPPEDCGGAHGYAELLVTLATPTHPDYADMRTWAGDFEPERFAIRKNGELGPEMKRLERLANEDESSVEAKLGIPEAYLAAILRLAPERRSAIIAIIAASLADEAIEAMSVGTRLGAGRSSRRAKR